MRSLKIISIIVLIFIFTCFLDVKAEEHRFTVFISDLHMGAKELGGDWVKYEDFWWEKEFKSFLEAIDVKGKGSTDLIINGDLFELLQSTNEDCNFDDKLDKNFGCSIDEVKKRLESILESHSNEIRHLRDFANSGNNRVIILAGNHDAALQIREISKKVVDKINANNGRVIFQSTGYWLSADGKVYAEHGHQIGNDSNKFENWPNPTISDDKGNIFIQRTFGESFVQKFFNKYEKKYPIIDNFNSDVTGLKYGLCAERTEGSNGLNNLFTGVTGFLEFIFIKISKEQFIGGLGDQGNVPDWDIAKVKKASLLINSKLLKNDKNNFYANVLQLSVDDPLVSFWINESAKNLNSADLIEFSNKELSDEDIQLFCYLNSTDKNIFIIKGLDGDVCPTKGESLGSFYSKFLDEKVTFKEHLEKRYKELGGADKINNLFEVFIYGHTHDAHDQKKFKDMIPPNFGNVKILNSGAWQRIITSAQFGEIQNCSKDEGAEIRKKLESSPKNLPPCYSFIMIEPATWPDPYLKSWYWEQETQKGQIVDFESCYSLDKKSN